MIIIVSTKSVIVTAICISHVASYAMQAHMCVSSIKYIWIFPLDRAR